MTAIPNTTVPPVRPALVMMAAIVPAAGCGARAGLNQNKILAPLGEQPLLAWTLQALLAAAPCLSALGVQLSQILIAARREEFDILHSLLGSIQENTHSTPVIIVEGGATRQHSVGNAARAANADFLLVHDAARPLLSPDLISRVTQSALTTGAAIAALSASDTVKIAHRQDGLPVVASTLDRQTVWLAQTPQVFRRDLYLAALESAEREGFAGTDCASLVERNGNPVALVEGEAENFKVTFAPDIERAASILRARRNGVN